MADAQKILPTEKLREGYPKINAAIDNAITALNKATTAETNAENALETANSVRTELNAVINRETDSDAMSQQAAVDAHGVDKGVLKVRLDEDYHEISGKIGIVKKSIISILDYEDKKVAVADGYDWTPAFNYALSLFQGVKVWVPIGEYLIKGQVVTPKYSSILGERIGLTQGIGTVISEGGARIKKVTEAVFMVKPSDITITPFVMETQSVIKGVGIIYPNQDPANTNEANVIRYAATIKASGGCCLENIRTWGAFNFFEGVGESITCKDIYGYTLGTAFYVKQSADVCRMENIHLNPNTARPVQDFIPMSKSRPESIAFFFEDCDGVHISNVHTWSYRTSLKVKGGSGGAQCNVTMNNFFFDQTGVAFDIDSDSNWGAQISNGICVIGHSDNPDYCGLLILNKTTSQSFFTPILLNNITVVRSEAYGSVVPTYMVNFKYQYLFDVRFTNVSYDNYTPFISPHRSYVSGKVRSANYQMDLEKDYQQPNWLKNADMQSDNDANGTPDNWTLDIGTRNLTITKDITGFMKLNTTDGMSAAYKGIYQRITLPEISNFRVTVKARSFDVTSTIWVRSYDVGYANMLEKSSTFDKNGYCTVTFSSGSEKKAIVDILVCPGTVAGAALVFEKAQLITDTRGYLL